MKNKSRIPNKYVSKLVLGCLRHFMEYRSDIDIEINEAEGLEPPYLVLGNHVSNWDPFVMNAYIDYPICFVTSDKWFRNPFLRIVLKYAGAIPKKKFTPDLLTVKAIIQAKKNNRVIGIFPEGARNWDGTTGDIIISTAKLVKLLKIPVVATVFKGLHLSEPRWGNTFRRGRVKISYKIIISQEEVTSLTEDAIYQRLNEGLYHDEYAYQKQHRFIYKGKKLAEGLERFLFACPKCQSLGHMGSKYDHFFCNKCGYQVTYTNRGFFKQTSSEPLFHNPRDWNQWQLEYLKALIFKSQKDHILLLRDKGANLTIFNDATVYMKNMKGSLILETDIFYFLKGTEEKLVFNPRKLYGINVQSNKILEFYYDEKLYCINFIDKSISAYKWVKALEMFKDKCPNNDTDKQRKVTYG